MQFQVLSSLVALAAVVSAQVTVNLSLYDDERCSGGQTFNGLIGEDGCKSVTFSSLRIFQGGGDSNGCFVRTFLDSNCQIRGGVIGPLSGGNSGCIGTNDPNTGINQPNYSVRLTCD